MPRSLSRRVLLVESDEAMARVLERELSRAHRVLTVSTIARALALLDHHTRVDVVVAAYRLKDGTASKLFDVVARRWRQVRRVLLKDAAGALPRRTQADSVVDTSANFEDLLNAIGS
jgi:DNA-binding NtrC family response regulator